MRLSIYVSVRIFNIGNNVGIKYIKILVCIYIHGVKRNLSLLYAQSMRHTHLRISFKHKVRERDVMKIFGLTSVSQ